MNCDIKDKMARKWDILLAIQLVPFCTSWRMEFAMDCRKQNLPKSCWCCVAGASAPLVRGRRFAIVVACGVLAFDSIVSWGGDDAQNACVTVNRHPTGVPRPSPRPARDTKRDTSRYHLLPRRTTCFAIIRYRASRPQDFSRQLGSVEG